MPDEPESALHAATRAIRALPYPHWEVAEERLARAVLEAAAQKIPASEEVMNELERLRSIIRSLAAERNDLAAEVSRLREAVLKLADDWNAKAATLTAAASRDRGPSRMTRAMLGARAQVLQDCAQALREAITAALLGEGAGDEK